jgi:hypothetical protein
VPIAPCGRAYRGEIGAHLDSPLSGVSVCISIRKNANSFYVAAVVKPLFPFFPSLASFLEELCHIVLISLHTGVLVLRRTGLATRVSTAQNRDDPSHHPWLNPAVPGHMTSMRLAASYCVEIYRLQRPSIRAGAHPPSPDSFCVCRREPESPEEATPSIRRRATQARNLLGSPPPAPRPRRDAASTKRLPLFEHRPRG